MVSERFQQHIKLLLDATTYLRDHEVTRRERLVVDPAPARHCCRRAPSKPRCVSPSQNRPAILARKATDYELSACDKVISELTRNLLPSLGVKLMLQRVQHSYGLNELPAVAHPNGGLDFAQ